MLWQGVLSLLKNCFIFQLEIPLAFSHLVHHDAGIFEVFMATAYHPKNSHCIYLDAKADEKVKQAVIGIINCYQEKYLKASIFFSHSTANLWGERSFLCNVYL